MSCLGLGAESGSGEDKLCRLRHNFRFKINLCCLVNSGALSGGEENLCIWTSRPLRFKIQTSQ